MFYFLFSISKFEFSFDRPHVSRFRLAWGLELGEVSLTSSLSTPDRRPLEVWNLEFGVWNFPPHSLPVPPVRRAIIDVGTNSIKLLVADIDDHNVIPVSEQSKQTRLGSGFYDSHRLQPSAIKATAQAVATFAQIARDLKASSIRVIATSAAREAVNAADLMTSIHDTSGLAVEIISGDE